MVQQVPNFPLVSLTTISKHVAKFRTSSSSTAIAFRFLMVGSEMFFRALVVMLVSTACLASHSFGADFATPTGQTDAIPTLKMPAANLLRPDSIFVFGGALSTESLGDTLQFVCIGRLRSSTITILPASRTTMISTISATASRWGERSAWPTVSGTMLCAAIRSSNRQACSTLESYGRVPELVFKDLSYSIRSELLARQQPALVLQLIPLGENVNERLR